MSLDVKKTLDALNVELNVNGITRTLIICGGASLILQGIVRAGRQTDDVDVIDPSIDEKLKDAVKAVAHQHALNEYWLNSGPISLTRDLKLGWESRIRQVYAGSNLIVHTIAREDMIFAKFWAQVDRREDFNDFIDLAPTSDEIDEAVAQTIPLDGNPNWQKEVDDLRLRPRKEMGHDK